MKRTVSKYYNDLYANEDTFHEIRDYLTLYVFKNKFRSILPYIIHSCCTDKEPKELFKNYNNNNIFTVNVEMRLQNFQILRKFQNFNILNIPTSINNISELIVVRSMLMEQENISKFKYLLYFGKISFIIRLIIDINRQENSIPWPYSIRKSKQNVTDFKAFILMVVMCQLYRVVQDLIDKHSQENVTIISPKILNEWKNIFIGDIQSGIMEFWMLYADGYSERTTSMDYWMIWESL
ncbi:hypothetical protein E2986_12011 [Frieseomelitta varia]|uniref:Uncharacterized protein n=1 Tax=Frieseomelitta varia TaxID=561572 RepID=A0A833RNK7_9HYME|nr:hypothetical protein E2986_12011 [Frieseomelitta varia]